MFKVGDRVRRMKAYMIGWPGRMEALTVTNISYDNLEVMTSEGLNLGYWDATKFEGYPIKDEIKTLEERLAVLKAEVRSGERSTWTLNKLGDAINYFKSHPGTKFFTSQSPEFKITVEVTDESK